MNLVKKTGIIFDKVVDLLGILAIVILVGVMLLVGADVVGRYLLHNPIDHVLQFTELSLVLIAFLPATWVLRAEGHVKIETFLTRLSPTTQLFLNFITSILGVIICLVLFWYGLQSTVDYFQRGIIFHEEPWLPQAPFLAPIVFCYLLLSIQFLRRSYGFLRQWRTTRS